MELIKGYQLETVVDGGEQVRVFPTWEQAVRQTWAAVEAGEIFGGLGVALVDGMGLEGVELISADEDWRSVLSKPEMGVIQVDHWGEEGSRVWDQVFDGLMEQGYTVLGKRRLGLVIYFRTRA